MKIAYLTFEVPGGHSGVAKKISAQAADWRGRGHEVRHFILARPTLPRTPDTAFLLTTSLRPPILAAALSFASIRRALRNWQPDIIYLRQMLWWPGAVSAINVAPMVIEYNSIARNEYRGAAPAKSLLERLSRHWFPAAAAGLVAVTQELADDVPPGRALRAVISNGFDFSRAQARRPPHNTRAQLLLVGSPGQPWHGVDKVQRLAGLMPECDFHVVVPGLHGPGTENLQFHGGLYGADLAQRYAQTDVAIGTLALHRKGMQQAAPLKTREYLAHGIPVMAGYADADLQGADYWLNIGNAPNNVEEGVGAMRTFVQAWRGRLPDRQDIERRLSYASKETQRLAFFERVLQHAG
ncbi:glycosyltransferase [Bordetella genomosp. 12]|uniref:Glycosyltransferase subfamily 4-like N-terminal domain-containing protein n=1 Tax=Bordetella genomosp. 12 TaxID=463035 RepID=A0A261VF58_9BORD|nr:glycosyltransferase [Bordetella genomosp. 12]OZI72182.1 hypothetical protein CAL22_20670 [Bordetella genomosp. 12]